MDGEKAFAGFLRRMSSVGTVHEVLVRDFGEDNGTWSRALQWMYHHLYTTYKYKLETHWSLEFFESKFQEFSDAAYRVATKNGWNQVLRADFNIMGAIDCHDTASCKTGGTPSYYTLDYFYYFCSSYFSLLLFNAIINPMHYTSFPLHLYIYVYIYTHIYI